MPLELIADRPGHALLREYEEPPLEPGEVRVRARFSSVKHGTELRGFRADTPDASDRFDSELRLHRRGEAEPPRFPMPLGNMCVGTVEEVGPDVVFETSGSYAALEDALRAVKYAGTVVSTAYYHGAKGLSLAGEWHRNRIEIVSSRAVSTPHLHSGWDVPRVREESLELLREGRLKADGLVAPVVPFARTAEAYHEICEHPERSIKLGVDHTG